MKSKLKESVAAFFAACFIWIVGAGLCMFFVYGLNDLLNVSECSPLTERFTNDFLATAKNAPYLGLYFAIVNLIPSPNWSLNMFDSRLVRIIMATMVILGLLFVLFLVGLLIFKVNLCD